MVFFSFFEYIGLILLVFERIILVIIVCNFELGLGFLFLFSEFMLISFWEFR